MRFLFSGTAGDSLGYHRGLPRPFTTKDRDNDSYSRNCTLDHDGAWWYKYCCLSNLNGLYLHGKLNWKGVVWYNWKKRLFCEEVRDEDTFKGLLRFCVSFSVHFY